MIRIKIISDPYKRISSYQYFQPDTNGWADIKDTNINSRLREKDKGKIFLPFIAKEIVDIIISEYYVGTEKIDLVFEGTTDEYEEMVRVCSDKETADKINLTRSPKTLYNARDILDQTKETFGVVQPIIKNIVKDDPDITKKLDKVSDALKDIIPVCIFGNYSAGKSTFINSLIGYEILPSGGDPVTSKIYEIKRSKQPDRAKISFEYRGETFELVFDNKECHVKEDYKQKDLLQEVLEAIEKLEEVSLFRMVNKTIDILNSFEKRDKTTTLISNVIRLSVPFCENGKLGQSHNEFVIFDTPGSNSNTNMDHEKVLTDSLEGFSNGIPIWVCGYDSIDSVDNANLCDKLYQIEALDKRFTMIVVNKADSVELPRNGWGSVEISNIMEYESVEKMYSSGIYFVSSVMGLGAINRDGIVSDYLLDVFEEKERKFSDPNARSYKKLYEYNIMPEQMKRRALDYSQSCQNVIYANSGLYCVEMEMEQFASRHAAYNKCQMVYMFLRGIIDETGRQISDKTARTERKKKKWENDLDSKKFTLVENIKKETQDLVNLYEKDSKSSIQQFAKKSLVYESTKEEIEKKDQAIETQNEQDANIELYEREYAGAKNSRWQNLIENSQNLFKGNFIDSFKKLTAEWASDSQAMQDKKKKMVSTRQTVDRKTSDLMLGIVVEEYRSNIVDAQNKLSETAKQYWQEKAQSYRDRMIRLITGTDALTDKHRAELSAVILNYPAFQYNDDADKVFIKANFLRGNIFGMSERLDISRLTLSYNLRIRHNIDEMAQLINRSCFACFKEWQENLQTLIEENITIYNPELRDLTDSIREEEERIHELQTYQQTISNSFMTIENMMAWKELE